MKVGQLLNKLKIAHKPWHRHLYNFSIRRSMGKDKANKLKLLLTLTINIDQFFTDEQHVCSQCYFVSLRSKKQKLQ